MEILMVELLVKCCNSTVWRKSLKHQSWQTGPRCQRMWNEGEFDPFYHWLVEDRWPRKGQSVGIVVIFPKDMKPFNVNRLNINGLNCLIIPFTMQRQSKTVHPLGNMNITPLLRINELYCNCVVRYFFRLYTPQLLSSSFPLPHLLSKKLRIVLVPPQLCF